MAICGSCGVHVPDGQRYCSMCYGDPSYGHDGYYQAMLDTAYERQCDEHEDAERRRWEIEAADEEEEPRPDCFGEAQPRCEDECRFFQACVALPSCFGNAQPPCTFACALYESCVKNPIRPDR